MYYEDLFRQLNKDEVDYVVVGGVALVLHGVVRLTADLDLMVALNERNLSRFIEVMEKLGYKPRVPVDAHNLLDPAVRKSFIEEKHMTVFSFYHPREAVSLIDIFIYELLSFASLKDHAVKIASGDVLIPVASTDDLIRLKKISNRPQDMADIAALEEVRKK